MRRRNFLALVGGGLVVGAGGATWTFANTRTPDKALAPWQAAGAPRYDDPRLHALSYAILAPNPHNRQPWRVELLENDGIRIFFDTERQLPHTDPYDRQLTIGFGCFLELLEMAANERGVAVQTALFPQGHDAGGLDERPVAELKLSPAPSVSSDPLFAHVKERRSTKEPFDTGRRVAADTLAPLLKAGRHGASFGGTVAEEDVAFWRELTERALAIELVTPHTYKESVGLFRIGKGEINANPDGIDLGGPMIEALALAGQFSREQALNPESVGYKQGREAVLENCRTAMGHVWMVTPANTRLDQIAAGRDWLRFNLACAGAGIAFQPLSQPLQEYPEMETEYRETHERLAPGGGTVQMLGRIGYGPQVPVSPRWPLEAKLVSA